MLAGVLILSGALAYLREPPWLASLESGFGAWEKDFEGVPYRWTSGRASFFVPADAAAVRIPLRSEVATPVSPAVVSVTVDDRLAEQLKVTDGRWQDCRVRLPPARSRRLRRIDLHVTRTYGGTNGLQVREIEVIRATVPGS